MEDTKSLHIHRQSLKDNVNSFVEDKDRAIENMTKHIWNWVKIVSPNTKKNEIKNILFEIAYIIFDAQSQMPLFQYISSRKFMFYECQMQSAYSVIIGNA